MKKPDNVSQGYWDMLTEEGKRVVADRLVRQQVTAEECNRIAANYYADGPDYAAIVTKLQAKARRDRIAEGFAFALVSGGYESRPRYVAERAVQLADALIAELDK